MGLRRDLEAVLLTPGRVTLVAAGFFQRDLRLLVEDISQALEKQQREDELFVVASINGPAQERGRAPEIRFELLLGDASHLRG
jgi:hypothetical protein